LLAENERQRQSLERTLGEVQASREQLTQILESIDDGFFSLNREWRITYINRMAERIWGRPPENYLGKSIWELWPELRGTSIEANYRLAMEEGQPSHFRVRGISSGW
jgi:PAS domain S-box-containing protein